MLADDGDTSGTGVLMPNGYTLHFRSDISKDAFAEVARAYHEIILKAQEEARLTLIRGSLTYAVIPCLAVAALGLGIAWIRRGFAKPE